MDQVIKTKPKNLFYFLLGLSLIVLTSATTASVIKTEPKLPKHTLVKSFWGSYNIEKNMESYIKSQVKKGYIVKTLCLDSEENGYQRGILIMEKY